MRHAFKSQDLVVFQKRKHGSHPGPRARHLRPAPAGEDYDSVIDMYWVVDRVLDDDRLLLRTPGGKLHEIATVDPDLRRLSLRERVWLTLFERDRLRALRRPATS
jgi:hypothetical protein